jgi:hypothetical protein
MALGPFVQRSTAQGHALVNGAAIADLRSLAHHDAHGMVKKNTVAYDSGWVDFYAC